MHVVEQTASVPNETQSPERHAFAPRAEQSSPSCPPPDVQEPLSGMQYEGALTSVPTWLQVNPVSQGALEEH
jgi:hypothetical protein